MSAAKTDRRESLPAAATVEPSSWWWFVAIFLGAIGCYGVLVVHLLLEATSAGSWGWAWMALPTAGIGASGVAMLMGSGMSLRAKFAVAPAVLLGYSPRERSNRQSGSQVREPA
jgi:hypothetical protein